MGDDFIAGLDASGGKYSITMAYPHVLPIMRLCSVSSTRAAVERAFNGRCIEANTPILARLVDARRRVAELLGYASYPAYRMEVRMAARPDAVRSFLADYNVKLQGVRGCVAVAVAVCAWLVVLLCFCVQVCVCACTCLCLFGWAGRARAL
jgi:hypothetical protein